jgi:hypothetical protein
VQCHDFHNFHAFPRNNQMADIQDSQTTLKSKTHGHDQACIRLDLPLIDENGVSASRLDAPASGDSGMSGKFVCGARKYNAGAHCKNNR